MTTGSEVAVRPGSGIQTRPETREPFSTGLVVSQAQIEQTKTSLALLRAMIKDVLVAGRDYGSVPGIPDEFLWDPGASQITASFNCRVGPGRVIKEVFTDSMVAVVLEVPIISFQNGQEVACCVGAASTTEVKHKYRWVTKFDLVDWGYTTNEAIATLKKKPVGKYWKYRIPNPEPGELLNTIWKIAHKRGRVGAAQLLPGVSSALREKFTREDSGNRQQRKPSSDWDLFWAEMTQLGLNEKQVHAYLGMKSVKDWVGTGQTLDQAKVFIVKKMGAEAQPGEYDDPGDLEAGEPPDFLDGDPLKPEIIQFVYKTDPKTISNLGLMYEAIKRDFPGRFMMKVDFLKHIGKKETDITDPGAEYATFARSENKKSL